MHLDLRNSQLAMAQTTWLIRGASADAGRLAEHTFVYHL